MAGAALQQHAEAPALAEEVERQEDSGEEQGESSSEGEQEAHGKSKPGAPGAKKKKKASAGGFGGLQPARWRTCSLGCRWQEPLLAARPRPSIPSTCIMPPGLELTALARRCRRKRRPEAAARRRAAAEPRPPSTPQHARRGSGGSRCDEGWRIGGGRGSRDALSQPALKGVPHRAVQPAECRHQWRACTAAC